ncbi:MAG TPA: DUF4190 domain-containing protein [Verrucomicrobiae bacterium]|nr:DUF4190 domain-containing protein [Verrucomicrobiae bacterium]
MYKIIGADGREYGPVSAEQIRQWIAEGRVNGQTLTQTAGTAEWKALASFPELLQKPSPPAPTILPPSAPQPQTNNSAIAGLVMGILSVTPFGWFCCIPVFGILGIIFSSKALSQINRNPLQETGKGMAVTGLILSILGLVAPLFFFTLFGATHMFGHRPLYWRWHRTW